MRGTGGWQEARGISESGEREEEAGGMHRTIRLHRCTWPSNRTPGNIGKIVIERNLPCDARLKSVSSYFGKHALNERRR